MSDDSIPLLKELIQDGTLELDNVLEFIEMNKRTKIRKQHRYAITPPNNGNRYWITYYKKEGEPRKLIRGKSENEILDKLIQLYESEENLDNFTFYQLYLEWLDYKTPLTNSMNTIKRYKQYYKKYFETSVLHNMKLSDIDIFILEKESNRIVKEFQLSSKAWQNAKSILNGMFDYAKRRKYLSTNPMTEVHITVRFRQVLKKTGKSQTYNTEELDNLNSYLDSLYQETNDSSFLAVKLNFYLGLRVGELVALKPEDVLEDHIHVIREEIRDQETNQCYIVDHTKTNNDRFVILVPKAKEILEKLDMSGTYLFERNGERLTARQIAYVLEKYAQRQGIETKSSHKIRKTYASRLNASGVPLDAIREQLGHTNLQTTLGYIYNPLTEKETYDLIAKAL